MKRILARTFVGGLFLLALLQLTDLFLWHPAAPVASQQPVNLTLSTLVQITNEKQAQKPAREIELPSALAETIPPPVSVTKQTKTPSPTALEQRTMADQNRFRLLALLLALIGTPLYAVIGATSLFLTATARSLFIDVVDKLTTHTLFLTLPLFTFAGYVLSESKAPERLVRFSRALLGWFPGGTAFIVVVSCAFFTAFTGASGVTIVALGGLLYPMLMREQYGENFTLGIITTGGSLGLLFPPSLPLILYAVIANHSMQGMGSEAALEVKDLFIAGLIPGTLMVLIIAVYGGIIGYKRQGEIPHFSLRELGVASWKALPEILIPGIMFVGYFGGYLQLTEAAAVTALYAVIVEVVIYRDIKLRQFPGLCRRSMVLIGAIILILMMAMALTNLLIMAKVPDQLLLYMKQHIHNRFHFLLLLNLFLLVVGCLMDIFSAILVVVPLVIPIAVSFGIDPLHLGVIFLTNLGIGYCTPPVGMNLFISSLRFRRSVFKVAFTCLPFLALLMFVLALVTYVPAISIYPAKHPQVLVLFFGCIFLIFAVGYLIAFLRKKIRVPDKISSSNGQ